jgi:hypothetical protein
MRAFSVVVVSLAVTAAACAKPGQEGAATDTAAAAAAAGGEQQRPASPRDSASATIGGATVAVNYGRPSMRGRAIFGGLVPYDRVWRTGANEATGFTTSADLVIGGTTVPAGSYTLYTVPKAASAPCADGQEAPQAGELVISRMTGQWGTEYDQGQDLARVPMRGCTMSAPVEQFLISIVPAGGDAGALRLEWEGTRYTIPFTVKR